jgi:glucosylglycerate phosphorylase
MNLEKKLVYLYGKQEGQKTAQIISQLISKYKNKKRKITSKWDEKSIALITYPDSFQEKKQKTFNTLNNFLTKYIKNCFTIVHVLPFYESTNDRGFSVVDYRKVQRELGGWSDVKSISLKYRLMADMVSNHVSKSSKWFKAFLRGDKKYLDYFIWFDDTNLPPDDQIKKVRRGRATPLLTPFTTKLGTRYLWTTYSIGNVIDQIDLNYKNPKILVEIIKVFLFYIDKNIKIIRLDGIGGLWKELGTACKHLPQNHIIVSIFKDIVKEIGSGTLLFSETTTATFDENISYMNKDEADVVYNFMLAPLVLQSFLSGSAEVLTKTAQKFDTPKGKTFFNILDIHDGINVYSVNKVLDDIKLQNIFSEIERRGGKFSFRSLENGEKAVKEMHITWWSALNMAGENNFEIELRKFITSRAIAMSLKGIPGVYYLSLFGQKNDSKLFEKTGIGRNINRTNLKMSHITKKLEDSSSRESKIFKSLIELINKRLSFKAFHPDAGQVILELDERVFALIRGNGIEKVIALHNVSKDDIELKYANSTYKLPAYSYIWEKLK